MKRTAPKRKPFTTNSPLRRETAVKRKRRTPEARLRVQLWELCKEIIRKRYGNICYTCGKEGLSGSSWQTGHFIPRSVCGAYLRYDLRNLRPQCYRCNIDLSGNGAVFYRNLVRDEGQAYVDTLFSDKERVITANRAFYQFLIDEYTTIARGLREDADDDEPEGPPEASADTQTPDAAGDE